MSLVSIRRVRAGVSLARRVRVVVAGSRVVHRCFLESNENRV